ncbi:MAG: SpoIID/LytB domain-containing protein [Lachnospiraceae bacterium]|nr:SpoIID/LytB domain-containing protein [Lachnospiraceae bacterium]
MRKRLLAGIILLLLPWILSLFWMRAARQSTEAAAGTPAPSETVATGILRIGKGTESGAETELEAGVQSRAGTQSGTGMQSGEGTQPDGTDRRILMERDGISTYMALEDYLPGVIACQINPDYSLEALKCQAVIARTYIYRLMDGRGEIQEEELDLDYLEERTQTPDSDGASMVRAKERIVENLSRFRQAVQQTQHVVMKYDGRCILPLFHARNNGRTRQGDAAYPYLQAVDSKWDTWRADSELTKIWSLADFAERINQIPEASLVTPDQLAGQIQTVKKDDSGYVLEMKIGAKTYSGEEIQYALGLSSSCFAFSVSGDEVKAVVRGSGHGYGLSQAGAEGMAAENWGYEEILQYYYKNILIVTE